MNKYHPILEELIKSKDQEYGIFLKIQERAKDFSVYSQDKTIEEIERKQQFEAFALEISNYLSTHTFEVTKKLCSMLNLVSEEELVSIVSATDAEYHEWENDDEYMLLDLFSLKKEIFKYIINPSKTVIDAHKRHCQHIENK